jgi:hypothetical protein
MVSDKSQNKSQFVRKYKIGKAGRMCKGLTFCVAKRFKLSILKCQATFKNDHLRQIKMTSLV